MTSYEIRRNSLNQYQEGIINILRKIGLNEEDDETFKFCVLHISNFMNISGKSDLHEASKSVLYLGVVSRKGKSVERIQKYQTYLKRLETFSKS